MYKGLIGQFDCVPKASPRPLACSLDDRVENFLLQPVEEFFLPLVLHIRHVRELFISFPARALVSHGVVVADRDGVLDTSLSEDSQTPQYCRRCGRRQ